MSSGPPLTSRKPPKRPKSTKATKPREFNLSTGSAKIPEYNALRDSHLGYFFRSKFVQRTLLDAGLIDKYGRLIDIEKNKGRLNIIEQEFRNAERAEEQRMREEEESRRLRHKLFLQEREERRKLERIERLKEEERQRHMRFLEMQSRYTVTLSSRPPSGMRPPSSMRPLSSMRPPSSSVPHSSLDGRISQLSRGGFSLGAVSPSPFLEDEDDDLDDAEAEVRRGRAQTARGPARRVYSLPPLSAR